MYSSDLVARKQKFVINNHTERAESSTTRQTERGLSCFSINNRNTAQTVCLLAGWNLCVFFVWIKRRVKVRVRLLTHFHLLFFPYASSNMLLFSVWHRSAEKFMLRLVFPNSIVSPSLVQIQSFLKNVSI